MKKHFFFPLLIGAIELLQPVYAATPSASINLEAGTEYDSNLSVVELDQYSTESDWATLFNARLNTQWKATEELKLKAGYSFVSKTYQDNEEFDLAIQQLFADASYDFSLLTLGASYHYADATLADQDFLQLQQTSLYASHLFNNRIFVRGAANFQDKKFPDNSERNASNNGLAGDMFIFFQQGKTFIAIGISSEEEDAVQDQFSFDGISLRSSINHKFSTWGKTSELQLGWRYQDRDYSAVTPELEARRHDRNNIISIEWEINLTPTIVATSKVERGDYQSNLPAADYSETLASLMLSARF
ncbi:MAG: hypothetical protein K0Q67_2321 [Cellvibrio sp.]|nr:hypothetical protein [Cellvibrio sp.]